ncbi:23 kDa integral membrane protein-like [Cimex lectularius]|uniref:Tetraspanin n=1 Tax=Cimex lectularius TaxID=79782 RepID=A0A8I6SCJ6_CIMLE|nr:23 kDa integral membrane protein-like [Cimex lectularius]
MCEIRKVYLLIATVITGAIGMGMISLGQNKMIEAGFLDAFLSDHIHLGRTFISVGMMLIVIALVGMIGVLLHIDIMLQIYAGLMFTLVITQILIGFIIFYRMDLIRQTLNKTLEVKYQNYELYKAEIDRLQKISSCCGMSGPKEWKIKELPSSCCGRENGSCPVSSAYSSSCSEEAGRLLTYGFYFVAVLCFILVVFEVKCALCACCMTDPCALFSCITGYHRKKKKDSET